MGKRKYVSRRLLQGIVVTFWCDVRITYCNQHTNTMENINFEEITLRVEITPSRGGGIEISLDTLGYEGEKMSAYQNYLGGGMLGKVCSSDTIRANQSFVEESICRELDEIAEQLKKYYFNLTNPEEETYEHMLYEQNQKLPVSAY